MFWQSKKKKEEEVRAKAEAEAAAKAAFEKAAPPPQPKTVEDMLLVALRNKNFERAEEAIARGADVNTNGGEPLVLAADGADGRDGKGFAMARSLVLAGADINLAIKKAVEIRETFMDYSHNDGYAGHIVDGGQYHRFDSIAGWLDSNKGQLREEYLSMKVAGLEQERDDLKRQVKELQEAAKPKTPASAPGA